MTANRTTTVAAAVLLFLAPATMLTLRGGTGYCFFLLLAVALVNLAVMRGQHGYLAPLRKYPLYTASMLAFTLYLPLQQLLEHYYLPRQFDAMSRLVLSLPIFLLFCTVSSRSLALVGWGCAAGAVGAGAWAFISGINASWGDLNRLGNYYTNPIPFGNTALLLGFLAVLSIRWDTGLARRFSIPLKLFALLAGGYASYLSGTRGGWLALPLFAWLVAANFGWMRHRARLAIVGAVLVVGVAALFSTHVVQQRLRDTASDLHQLEHGNADTSIGLRLQLWNASSHLFLQNPVLGVGKGKLESSLQTLANNHEASQAIVNERAHSEFFSTIAELGTFGIACLLLLYWGPLAYFLRHRRSADATVSTAAYCGIAVSGSAIIFGLSIDILSSVMNVALIALLWATMMAIIHRGTRTESAPAKPQTAI